MPESADSHQPVDQASLTAAIAAAMTAVSPKVTYDVSDLLDRIGTRLDQGFARVETALVGKADKSDLAAINARLEEHGREIGRIKDQMRSDEAASAAVAAQRAAWRDWRRWAVGLVVLLAAASPGFVSLFH